MTEQKESPFAVFVIPLAFAGAIALFMPIKTGSLFYGGIIIAIIAVCYFLR